MPDLTEGRIVHVRLPNGRHAGECRPAIVVKAWSPTVANMQVFIDGSNDDGHSLQVMVPGALAWFTSVAPATETNPYGWHWPTDHQTDAMATEAQDVPGQPEERSDA